MTNLEICKRIAEIEDHITIVHNGFVFCPNVRVNYNPLTDDALCFQLMVKYRVDILNYEDTCEAVIAGKITPYEIISDSHNKAICLAIIEAHND